MSLSEPSAHFDGRPKRIRTHMRANMNATTACTRSVACLTLAGDLVPARCRRLCDRSRDFSRERSRSDRREGRACERERERERPLTRTLRLRARERSRERDRLRRVCSFWNRANSSRENGRPCPKSSIAIVIVVRGGSTCCKAAWYVHMSSAEQNGWRRSGGMSFIWSSGTGGAVATDTVGLTVGPARVALDTMTVGTAFTSGTAGTAAALAELNKMGAAA
eukprot:357281-Chlamydomonas_euryale.AAC.25